MQYTYALLWVLSILILSDLAASQSRVQPNIIFILADDLGWRDVGYAGADYFETPNIDRLAEQGMTFTAAYASGANCSPSRACLMSGTYTPRHHIYTPGGKSKGNTDYMRLLVPARNHVQITEKMWAKDQFDSVTSLDPGFICIPEVLKPVGYVSARIGKWHIGRDTQGFDLSTVDGIKGPRGTHYGEINVAEQLTDRAVRFIEDNKQGPFFLYLSHWDVHVPHNAKPEIIDKYGQKRKTLPKS